ncbi:MAG: hypothetical protein K2K58_05040, partial [Muribaculaceae bacterium]|nr:hypothetical protein [Muribaculaceae bacterium]
MRILRYAAFLLIFINLATLFSCSSSGGQSNHRQLPLENLKTLDKTLEDAPLYVQKKQDIIDSLRRVAESENDPEKKWHTLLALSSQYRLANADSAVLIAKHALETIPEGLSEEEILKGKLIYIQALATSGLFYATLSRLDSLKNKDLSLESKIELWKTARIAYSYAASYTQGLDQYTMSLIAKQDIAKDSLLKYLPPENTLRRFLYCSDLVNSSNWDRAKQELTKFLKEVPPSDNLHGMVAYQLAQAYKNQGDFTNYVTYLADAAGSDIQANVKEGLAMQELAKWLYQQGDHDRANRYISAALSDATSGNVRMRTAAISNIAPLIESSNRRELKASHTSMTIYAVTSTILFIITAILAYIFLRNSRKIRANEKKLSSSTKKL